MNVVCQVSSIVLPEDLNLHSNIVCDEIQSLSWCRNKQSSGNDFSQTHVGREIKTYILFFYFESC
jgi:hypothetical protein